MINISPEDFNSKKIWEEDQRAAANKVKKPSKKKIPQQKVSSKKKIPTPKIPTYQQLPKITRKATSLKNVNKNISINLAKTEPEKPCFPDSAELDKLSRSPKGFQWDPEKSKINEKILFHIHGDEFGQGSELEGINSALVLNYIHSFLEKKQGAYGLAQDKMTDVLKQLQVAEKLAESNNFVKDARKELETAAQTKKSVLIAGGWKGKPLGHSIYYEIIPDSKNASSKQTASIRFYQLGLGSDEHLGVVIGNKIKRKPFYELRNVDYDRLLNGPFLEAVNEMRTLTEIPDTGEGTNYAQEDVYQGLHALVGGDPVISDTEQEVISMSTQRAGVCSFRSLMAWMKLQLGDEYKIFKCDLQLKSLIDSVYGDTRSSDEVSFREWNLVNKSLEKFARHLDIAYEKGIIGKEYLRDAQILLKPVKTWLNRHQSVVYRAKIAEASEVETDFKYTPVEGGLISEISHKPLSAQISTSSNIPLISSQSSHHFVKQFQSIHFDKPEMIIANLKSVIGLIDQAIDAHEYAALEESMVQLMKRLPLEPKFWETQDQETAKEIITLLGEVSKRFFQNCFMTVEGAVKIEPIYVLAKLMTVQTDLLPEAVKNVPLDWERLLWFDDLFFGIADDQIQKELVSIGQKYRRSRELSYDIKRGVYADFSNSLRMPFLKDYLKKEESATWQTIVDHIPDYEYMAETELEANFYASPYLPDWIRSSIDCSMQIAYLLHEPVAPVTPVNFEFEIKRNPKRFCRDEDKSLFIKLKEIPKNQTRKEKEKRFLTLYRSLGSLQGLVNTMPINRFQKKEKELSTKSAAEVALEMTDEDYHELDHIWCSKNLQVCEAIDYFSRHPTKLQESDYQVLLQLFLFNIEALKFAIEAGSGPVISAFISSHFSYFKHKGDLATASFMLMLARKCRSFIPDDPFFKASLDHTRQLLSTAKDPYVRSLLYRELAINLDEQEKLTETEVKELLEATIFLQRSPIIDKWRDPASDAAVRRALIKHSHHIQKALLNKSEVNQHLLNALFKAVFPNEKEQIWIVEKEKGKFPLFYTEGRSFVFSPLEAKLYSQKNPEKVLPYEITSNPLFARHFSGIQTAQPQGEIYSFRDNLGHETLVQIDKQTQRLIIEQKREEGWCRLMPKEDLLGESENSEICSAFFDRTLAEDFDSWQLVQDPQQVFICDHNDQKNLYQAQFETDGAIKSITRLADQAVLGTPSAHFLNFEEPEYTQNWYEPSGKLKEIILPRFGLTFKPDANDPGSLVSKEFTGYRLIVGQPVRALGGFERFLLLIKDDQKKLLIPKQEFLAPDEKFEVLEFRHKIDKNLDITEENKQSFAVYDFSADVLGQEWTCNTEEDRLFFAAVQALVQKYKEAASTLRKTGEKRGPYSENEKKILQQLISLDDVTADNCGNATFLRALGGYLLTRNALNYNYMVPKETTEKIRQNYLDYLNHYRQITIPGLKSYEELLLLKQMIEEEWNPILFNRLQELDPKEASKMPFRKGEEVSAQLNAVVIPKLWLSEFLNATLLSSINNTYLSANSLQSKSRMITRPYEHVKENLSYYINVAINGPKEEQAWLNNAIAFANAAKIADSFSNELDFLKIVLENPDQFNEINSHTNVTTWVNETLAQIRKLDQGQPEIKRAIPQIIEKTPANFALNMQAPLPAMTIPSLDYTPLDPLLKDPSEYFTKIEGHKDQLKTELTSQSSWFAEQAGLADDNPLYQELTRLKKDTDDLAEKPILEHYSLKEDFQNTLSELESKLNADKEDAADELKNLRNEITELANAKPSDLDEQARKEIQLLGERLRPIAFGDVLIAFAKKDVSGLIRLNPHLSEDQLHTLFQKAGSFLELATFEQQRERSLNALQELKDVKATDQQRRDDLLQELAAQCSAKRSYDSRKHPAYLAFEYYANLLMRSDQCEKLEVFLKEGNLNPIIEMIMGSGKSKVLLPLLALLRADGKTISMLIVPETLLESVASDTEQILSRSFGQELHYLHFDRNTVFAPYSLKAILQEIKIVQTNKECLIMTQSSLQSLILKFVEANIKDSLKGVKTISPMVSQMREILNLLGTDTQSIIDEADSVLSVITQMCYGVGDQSELEDWEIALISEMFGVLYEDASIRDLAKLECDSSPNPDAPVLTSKLYVDKVQRKLAEAFLERLKTVKFEPEEMNVRVKQFFNHLKDDDRALALDYLCQFQEHRKEAQAYFDKQNSDIQDILALGGAEISGFLSHTLSRTSDENYGLHQPEKSALPIPFGAVALPRVGSQFANEYVTANYAFQIYRKKKIPKELVITQVKRIQEQIANELMDLGSEYQIQDTKGWKTFEHLRGKCNFPLDEFTDEQLETLIQDINQDPARLREFISYVIMPQLKLHNQTLSCNAHNLIAFLNKTSGFTGTLYNSKSMHRNLNTQPAKGIDAKTIHILRKNSLTDVSVIKEGNTQSMLEQIEDQGIDWRMITDTGGYFKEGTNASLARKIAHQKNMPVVYYNAEGKQIITDGVKDSLLKYSKIPPDKRLTFLDQSHTTGADVKQDPYARSVLTIGKDTILRDLLQSVWRLRSLDKSQKISFVLSEEIEKMIRQTIKITPEEAINFDHILLFAIQNQAQRQGRDNFTGLCMELATIPQMLLLKALLDPKLSEDEFITVQNQLKEMWLQSGRLPPRKRFGQMPDVKQMSEIVAQEKKQTLDTLELLFKTCPALEKITLEEGKKTEGTEKISNLEKSKKAVDEVIKKVEGFLAKEMVTGKHDEDKTMEIERELEKAEETETELESQHAFQSGKIKLGEKLQWNAPFKLFNLDDYKFSCYEVPIFSLKDFFAHDPALAPYEEAFSDIYVTLNHLQWPEKNPSVKDFKLFGPLRTPMYYVGFDKVNNTLFLTAQKDLGYDEDVKFFHVRQGPIYCRKEEHPQLNAVFKKELFERLTKIKFLSGESSFTKEEQAFLRTWLETHGVQKLKKFYFDHVLKDNPSKKADYYSKGNLKRLFDNLTKQPA